MHASLSCAFPDSPCLMHSDLLLLRVACRVVEAAPSPSTAPIPKTETSTHMLPRLVLPTITAVPTTTRIPALPPIDRKRPADETTHTSPERKRQCRVLPPPGVFMDSPLAKLVHAQRSGPMPSPLGVEGWATPAKEEDDTSPPATPSNNDAILRTSPLRVPSIPPMRSTMPLMHRRPPTASPPFPAYPKPSNAMPPLALPLATKPPTLVRKVSTSWRQSMPALDRTHTRERILRGFDRQCRGDYDALLMIVTALEEELLHAQTTSKDHYFVQTMALHDRIATLAPPRTTLPSSQV